MGHLIDVSLASVEQRKISRDGSRSDMRNGLFPTPSGADPPQRPREPATPANSRDGLCGTCS
jgi:hypothetical protein